MWEMKMDMAGAATALAALCAIATLKLPIHINAVLVLAENRPSSKAILPGDIFKAKNGKTVMVDNTDAEGRLVLSDGLAEAGALNSTHIIDLATLTGAIIRAIGPCLTGLFCNDEAFANQISDAGKSCGEKLWKMPLEMEYREALTDKVADLCNIGGEAGAITAALFLQEFVPEKTKWAHLDIAGTAFTTKKWKYIDFGATGWGVQSLVNIARSLEK
jgi:leucyl aminopeptidase